MDGFVVIRSFEGALLNPSTGLRAAGETVRVTFCARCVVIHVPASAHIKRNETAIDSPWTRCQNCGEDLE